MKNISTICFNNKKAKLIKSTCVGLCVVSVASGCVSTATGSDVAPKKSAIADNIIAKCDINRDGQIYGKKEAKLNGIDIELARAEYKCKSKMELNQLTQSKRLDEESKRLDEESKRLDEESKRLDEEGNQALNNLNRIIHDIADK